MLTHEVHIYTVYGWAVQFKTQQQKIPFPTVGEQQHTKIIRAPAQGVLRGNYNAPFY